MDATGARLLVLGAGIFQIDVIRSARALGATVITLDNVPDNVGHALAHERVECSTVDVEGVVAAARAHRVDGIVTAASDAAVPALAVARTRLGLPGAFAPEVAHVICDKGAFRRRQHEAGLAAPEAVEGRDASTLARLAADLPGPLIVKPADSSGSRGVARIDAPDALRPALERALAVSRQGAALVEGFVDGVEVGGDAFLRAGEIEALVVTEKFLDRHAVAGHFVPDTERSDEAQRVRAVLTATCGAVGYRDGPLNFDVVLRPDGPVVLELGARTGGNGIPCLALRARGIDFHRLAVQGALGLAARRSRPEARRSAGSIVLSTGRAGLVRALPDLARAQARFPELWDLRWCVRPGDVAPGGQDSDAMLGLALFDCASPAAWTEAQRAWQTWIHDELLEPGSSL